MWVASRAAMRLVIPPTGEGSTRGGADEALGGGAGLFGDLGAGEHAGDLLAPALGGHLVNTGGDALAAVERVLRDQIVTIGAGGDLRRVRHRYDLNAGSKPRQPHA